MKIQRVLVPRWTRRFHSRRRGQFPWLAILLICLACCTMDLGAASMASHEKLDLHEVQATSTTVPRYGLFELTLDVRATYDNPFDPEDVDVWAQFVSPNGITRRVNAFYDQDCSRTLESNQYERIVAVGKPHWHVRFTPNSEGRWRYRIHARDASGETQSRKRSFKVVASSNPGFVRRNDCAPHLFARDDGSPYLAIGENMCWGNKGGTYDFDQWLQGLSAAGGNWIRLFMHRESCGLEWNARDQQSWFQGEYGGLGVYNLVNAWKVDAILDAAAHQDVQVMLCLGTFGEFTTGGFYNEGIWDKNPYNAANGGPCATPEEFWTNATARKFYRQRLRYLAARYGWRTNLFAWEFWNEAHPTAAWVEEMSQYLKGHGPFAGAPADPFGHLVSITYGTEEIWKLPAVDFTMTHHYGEGNINDHAPVIHDDAARHRAFAKPHLMAEYGIDWRKHEVLYDPQYHGVNLHNGLWASLASGNAGGAMLWHWDLYIHPGNLYREFTPLRRFADAVDWNAAPWEPLETDPPVFKTPGENRELAIAPEVSWERASREEFVIDPLAGTRGEKLPTFLFGPIKPDLRRPLTFRVNYEHPGRFGVHVDKVSSQTLLVMALDGKAVLERRLSAAPPPDGATPEYERVDVDKEKGYHTAVFNKTCWIDVPAGEHAITLDVTDGDWLSVKQYRFDSYVDGRYANLRVYGLTNGSTALLWVQNMEHHWKNWSEGREIPAVGPSRIMLKNLPPCVYRLDWWDTARGVVTQSETVAAAPEGLDLNLPEIKTDLALILRKTR